jgi:hypothetical protein
MEKKPAHLRMNATSWKLEPVMVMTSSDTGTDPKPEIVPRAPTKSSESRENVIP